MGISVIVDDAFPTVFNYYGSQWSHEANLNTLYNRTLTVCNTKNTSLPGPPSLTFNFYGSDINIYGPVTSGVALNYTVDGTDVRPGIINSDAIGKNNVDLWNLEGLEDNIYHTVQILPSAGQFSFDYITYTPNIYTGLTGRDLILDDADEAIQYSPNGNWTHTTGDFDVGLPYKGTMSGSNSQGATLKFDFVGASIYVYGLLNQVDGKLSASFSVDGGSTATYAPFDGTQTVNASSWILSQTFFLQDLVPGNHSLLVTLEEATGSQKLWIDYLLFEGTANTPINQTSGSSGGSSSSSPSSSSSSKLSNSAIGGIVAGAIVLFVIISRVHYKFKAKVSRPPRTSNTIRPRPPPSAPAPPPPMPQPMTYVYAMVPQPEIAMMNSGYNDLNSGMPMPPPRNSMPFTRVPAPVPQPQMQMQGLNYRPPPPPVDYANNPINNQNLRPHGQPDLGSSLQSSFTEGSGSGQIPQSPPMPQLYAPQPPHPSSPQGQGQMNNAKSQHGVLTRQAIATPAHTSGSGPSSQTQVHQVPDSELDTDPNDDPPPSYDEGF